MLDVLASQDSQATLPKTSYTSPGAFMQAAFKVDLVGLYGFIGCQNTRQILPEVQAFPSRHRDLEDPFQNRQ